MRAPKSEILNAHLHVLHTYATSLSIVHFLSYRCLPFSFVCRADMYKLNTFKLLSNDSFLFKSQNSRTTASLLQIGSYGSEAPHHSGQKQSFSGAYSSCPLRSDCCGL